LAAGIFWACTLLIVYTYVGYPLVLLLFYSLTQMARDLRYVLGRQDRRVEDRNDYEPRVSFVIAAYNEEGDLPAKLRNLAETDYPPAKLEILCVSDGSTDRTAEMLRTSGLANLRAIVLDERRGKPNALNVGCAEAQGEVLVFSDAATLFAP